MKAIVQDRYGSADVLHARDIEKPAIGDDEVLVRVRAAVDPRRRLDPDDRLALRPPPRVRATRPEAPRSRAWMSPGRSTRRHGVPRIRGRR